MWLIETTHHYSQFLVELFACIFCNIYALSRRLNICVNRIALFVCVCFVPSLPFKVSLCYTYTLFSRLQIRRLYWHASHDVRSIAIKTELRLQPVYGRPTREANKSTLVVDDKPSIETKWKTAPFKASFSHWNSASVGREWDLCDSILLNLFFSCFAAWANYSERWIHKQNGFEKIRALLWKLPPFVQIGCSIHYSTSGGRSVQTFDQFFFAIASRNIVKLSKSVSMRHSNQSTSILVCFGLF